MLPSMPAAAPPAAPAAAGCSSPRNGLSAPANSGDRHRLQPDPPRAGHDGEVVTVVTHVAIGQAGHPDHLEGDRGLEETDVARVHPHALPRLEIEGQHLTGEIDEAAAGPSDLLEDEAHAAEDAARKDCWNPKSSWTPGGGRHEAVAVDHVLGFGTHIDGDDVPWRPWPQTTRLPRRPRRCRYSS